MTLEEIKSFATEVHRTSVEEAFAPGREDETLCGMCAWVSWALVTLLRERGVEAELHQGLFCWGRGPDLVLPSTGKVIRQNKHAKGHVWVFLPEHGMNLDISGAQFVSSYPMVALKPKGDRHYATVETGEHLMDEHDTELGRAIVQRLTIQEETVDERLSV